MRTVAANRVQKLPGVSALTRTPMHPWLAFALVAGTGLALWGYVEVGRRERIQLETRVVADQVCHRLDAWIDARIAVIGHFANNWEQSYAASPEQYQREACQLLSSFPGMTAINWVDTGGVIRLVAPVDRNRAALGKQLFTHADEEVRGAILEAAHSGLPRRTSASVQFFQGGTGFSLYWPILARDGRRLGFVNGVFRVQDLIEECLAEESLQQDFRLDVTELDCFLAYGASEAQGQVWPYQHVVELDLLGRPWFLRVAPSRRFLAAQELPSSALVLLGVLGTAIIVMLMQRLSLQRRQALLCTEDRVRLLLDSTGEGIFGLDLDGHCTFCNASCLEQLGYDQPAQLLGENMHEQIHCSDLEGGPHSADSCRLCQASREGREWHGDGELFRRRDGSRFPVECRSNPILVDGAICGAVVTFSDITQRELARQEREQLERQYHQAQKLESLGLLAGGVAHDFNNLLVGILGNASLVLESLPADSPSRAPLATIATAAERASELTAQLLCYSGRRRGNTAEVDLVELVQEMTELLQTPIAQVTQLQLTLHPDTAHVTGDATELRQVVMNLITNAADALREHPGELHVRVRMQTGALEAQGGLLLGEPLRAIPYCLIEVQDTGGGMSAATQRRIFDPFFTTKQRGRGLGLSAVLGIVAGHGGTLQLQSELGRGTRMRIYLPPSTRVAPMVSVSDAAKAPAAAPAASAPHAPLSTQQTVLVIDDEPAVREVVKRSLMRGGYAVLEATSGEEGVHCFRQHRLEIDVVLMDLSMPGMDGVAACALIQEIRPEVPIVLTSGHPEQWPSLDLGERGFVDFLQKPFRVQTLLAKMDSVLAAS